MGDILPFVAKVRSSGDWTATERARLEELADRFAAAGVKVEVVYGVSEDGDPWCVVKDEGEEILVHVARIGGAFVVHSSIDDALREGQDLRSALGERLSWAEPDERVVVPFGRHAQTFLALLVATAFFYDTAAAPAPDEPPHDALPEPDAMTAPLVADAGPAVDKREVAQHASVLATTDDPAPRPVETTSWAPEAKAPEAFAVRLAAAEDVLAAPAHTTAPPPAPQVQAAPPVQLAQAETPGVRLTGSAGADHLVGTAGDDTLSGGGAPKGGHDLLEGGAGNDRIELGAQVIAIGGSGADTFVIVAPAQPDHADTLLGVVLDFHFAEGDKLVTAQGRVLVPTLGPQVTVNVDGDSSTAQTFVTGRRVEVDTDGDGKPDGYVVLADQAHADDQAVTAVGQGLSHPEFFG